MGIFPCSSIYFQIFPNIAVVVVVVVVVMTLAMTLAHINAHIKARSPCFFINAVARTQESGVGNRLVLYRCFLIEVGVGISKRRPHK
jgi:hypothetical protein